MTGVNFFESTINVNIMIHRGGHIIVANNAKTLFEGDQYSCMSKIRQMVNEVSALGDKKIVFHIQNMTTAGDSSVVYAKGYFKSNLERLNSSSQCNIEVKAGLYNVFA